MRDRLIKLPGNCKEDFHKGDPFNVSRKVKGIIRFIKFNFKNDETELRISVK